MYLALYRKFRPQNFNEIVGQEHIVTTLKNQIKSGQIAHAYLFTGPRGTGKTSVAKIFASSINCENNVSGNMCGKCATCQALSSPSNMDILEIDAASNNRVDEIRDLREHVKYPPVNGKFKVYIIDEVHMLTDSAFNALLKTLEEPPKHVVFVLATTEVQKLPATILSRCLRFDFKLLTNLQLEKHLAKVLQESGAKFEAEALPLIASLGEGSVRDTLSIAETVMAFSNKNITYQSVLESVGAIDKSTLFQLGGAVLGKNASEVINKINQLIENGKSATQIAKDLSGYYRDLAVVKTSKNAADILHYPHDLFAKLNEVAKAHSVNEIINCLREFSGLENSFRNTNNTRLVLEVCALKLTQTNGLPQVVEGVENVNNAEKKSPKTVQLSVPEPQVVKVVELTEQQNAQSGGAENANTTPSLPKLEKVKVTNTDVAAFGNMERVVAASADEGKKIFGKLLIKLRKAEQTMLHALLGSVEEVVLKGNDLVVSLSDEVGYNMLQKEENKSLILQILNEKGKNLTFSVKLIEIQKEINLEEKLKNMFGNLLTITNN